MTERQSVTYCEIDIDVCSHQFGKGGCYGQLGYEGGGAPNAVAFDGVATYLTRGGGLTGAGDAKTGTVSVWIRRENLGGRILAASTTRIIIAGGTAKFELIGANAGGSTILNLRTLSDIPDDGKYHHILASFDLSNPARRHVYLDDEPDLDVLTWIDDVVDFTLADWGVAATSTGTSKLEGGLAELWFQPGLYLDLSDEENRRKFITADLRPVDLGPSGDAPTGSAPLVYLGGAPESWHINLGTGGGFTVHGSPEDDTFSTGDEKCFNSPGSCQAKAAFDKSTVTLRFAKATDRRPADIEAIPVLTDVRYEPAVAAPGVDLGTAPRITFRFITTPHADAGPGFDPYRSERAYNPYEQGDLWAKFRARQPFLKGAPIRWIQGFVSDELADMETRHFVVEDFNGPDADGVFTITGSSPLRKLFGQTAAAPAPTTASLLGSITSGDSTAVLTPLGSGSQYAASGHVAIGSNEIAAFTRSGDTLTLAQRGALGTTAAAHESGERIQQCLVYEPQDVALIIYDLIVNQAGLPAEWCDLAAWQVETTTFLARLYSARLPDPTSINKLLVELIQQCGLFIWWDELGKQVRLQVLRPIDTDSVVYDESVYLADSFEPEEQLATRKSQVWVKYAQANPLRGEDDDNFDAFALFVPPEFTPGGDEDVGERSIEHVKSRWIVLGAQATAQRMAELLLSRYLRPPRRMRLRLFRHSHERPEIGQGCLIKHRMLQDPSGAPVLVPAQIISVRPDETGYDVIALEMDFVLLSLASAGLHDLGDGAAESRCRLGRGRGSSARFRQRRAGERPCRSRGAGPDHRQAAGERRAAIGPGAAGRERGGTDPRLGCAGVGACPARGGRAGHHQRLWRADQRRGRGLRHSPRPDRRQRRVGERSGDGHGRGQDRECPPRLIPGSREGAAPDEIRDRVPESKASWWSKVAALWGFIVSTLLTVGGWLVENLAEARTLMKPVTDLLGSVPWWLYCLLLAGGFLLIWHRSRASEVASVEAYIIGARR